MNEEIKKQIELDQLNYLVKLQKQELSKEKPFRFQFHTPTANGKNFRLVIDLLQKVIAENKLKIEVTEVPYDKITELETKLQKCVEALEFYAKAWELGFYTGELLVRKCSSNDAFEEVHERARSVLAELKEQGEK